MAAETFTWSPQRLLAGHDPDVITVPGTLLSGQNLAAGTLLESDAAGKWKVHANAGAKVAGILMNATNATSGDTACTAYVAGNFWADQLTFPAAINTNLLKTKFVEGTMIVLAFLDTGEV